MKKRRTENIFTGLKTPLRFLGWVLAGLLLHAASGWADMSTNSILRRAYTSKVQQNLAGSGGGASNSASLETEERLFANQMEVVTGDMETRYIIVPGDILAISYKSGSETSTAQYKVSSGGTIFLPYAGEVKVSGISKKEATERITEALQLYIRHPAVKILINNAGTVLLLGAVNTPQAIDYRPNMTLLEAILKARGYNEATAQLKNVLVIRGASDKPKTLRLDLSKMIKKGDISDNIPLKPGDIVYIPTSFISNLDNFLARILSYVEAWYVLGGQDIIAPGTPFLGPFEFKKSNQTTYQATLTAEKTT